MNADMTSNMMHTSPSNSTMQKPSPMEESKTTMTVGHAMTLQDPENPQNWPVYRKVYASFTAYAFGFAV